MPRALLPLPLCRIFFSENNPILTPFAQAPSSGKGVGGHWRDLALVTPPAVCAFPGVPGLLAPLCESLPF